MQTAKIIPFEPNADDVVEGILVSLSIRHWKGRKKDKEVTDEVASDKSVTRDVGAYHKRLFDKEALKKISSFAYDTRQEHWRLTMPWSDGGQRLLPMANLEEYTERMAIQKNKIEAEVKEFLDNYYTHVADAKKILGGLYNKKDYKKVDVIAAKFSFDLSYAELPTGDLRVSMSEDTRRELVASIQQETQQRVYDAVEDKLQGLVDQLRHYRDKICGEHHKIEGNAAIFRNSSLKNVGREIAIVRAINLTNDPRIHAVCDDIEALANEIGMTDDTAEVHAHQIRNNPTFRKNQKQKADDMLKGMGFA